jgi:polyisoprenyl-phosphate glycosyltransferase
MTNISVVAPIFNESDLIPEFVKQVVENVEKISSDYEIILVDDGSADNSWSYMESEALKNKKVKAYRLSKNFGHHYAITAGLHNASGEWVVVMDSDLQDRPEVIPELYEKAQQGFDVVFVSRTQRPESFVYKGFQKLFYWLLRVLSGIKFDSRQANFSIINKKVVEAFIKFPEHARFYGSTIKWLGFNRTDIQARHGQRFSGKPGYTIKKRISLAADIIISFSGRPLRFAIVIGLLMSFVSLLLSIWVLVGAFSWGFAVLGWPSLMASILFTGGAILVVLGIIGIYLGRVFQEVKSRPLYIVSETRNVEIVK